MSVWQLLSSFPTAVPTVLLAVLLLYWLVSIVGGSDLDLDSGHAAHDVPELHTVAGYLVALGLGGVPLSVVASVLVFVMWLATALLHQYVLVLVPTALLRTLAGAGVLLFAALLAVPIAARLLKPLRGLFVKHSARENASLVGRACTILTQRVDERFGRAEVEDSGTSLNIRVWAATPNTLSRHAAAIIVRYDEGTRQYEVQAAPEPL